MGSSSRFANQTTTTDIGAQPENLNLGVSAAIISILLFCTMDATVKWLGANYPVHQIMFFRCTLAFVPVLLILYKAGGIKILKTNRVALHGVRSFFGLLAMASAFYGFTVMPLADASSVFYTAPLLAVAFSVPILGERVGMRRWIAVIVGLVGVMIILRPIGSVFNLGGMCMFAAAILVGLTSNIVRKLNATEQAICITFYFTLSGSIVSILACLYLGWVIPGFTDFLLLVCVGLLGGSAQYALTLSFRYAEVSVVAPLKYMSIVLGGVFGYLIWNETPDFLTLLGMVTIIGSGVYSVHREAIRTRELKNRNSH